MEVKKSPKADLEGKKTQWLLIGYVVVLAFIFVAFEWTERDIKIDTSQAVAQIEFEEEMIPITQQEEKPAPPPVEVPKQAEILKIVDDEADVQETAIASTEDTGQKVEVKYVPVEVKEEEPSEQEIFEVVENAPEFPVVCLLVSSSCTRISNIRRSLRKTVLRDRLSSSSLLNVTVA